MTPERRARLRRLAASAVLLAVGISGIRNGLADFGAAVTAGQKFTTFAGLGHGLASFAALAALWLRPAWARPLLLLWAALLTTTAAAATIAWGQAGIGAAVAGGAAVAAFCALIFWLAVGFHARRRDLVGPSR